MKQKTKHYLKKSERCMGCRNFGGYIGNKEEVGVWEHYCCDLDIRFNDVCISEDEKCPNFILKNEKDLFKCENCNFIKKDFNCENPMCKKKLKKAEDIICFVDGFYKHHYCSKECLEEEIKNSVKETKLKGIYD
jgi:hypothetical protein